MHTPYAQTLSQTADRYARVSKNRTQAQTCADSLTRLINISFEKSRNTEDPGPAADCANYFVALLTGMSQTLATGAQNPAQARHHDQKGPSNPQDARTASECFHQLTLSEAQHIHQIISDGPDRAPEWSSKTKHAHMVALELAATMPNPFEGKALLSNMSPGEAEEDSLKEKAQLWNHVNNRYNETLSTVMSPNLMRFPELVERLNDTDIPASGAVTGIYIGPETNPEDSEEIPTSTWDVTAYSGFIHRSQRHFKAINDPYPKGTRLATVLEHLAQTAQTIVAESENPHTQFSTENIQELHRLTADMTTLAHLSLHQITPKDLQELAGFAEAQGLPPGAVTGMLHRTTFEDRLTTILADDIQETWRTRINPQQARALVRAAQEAQIDAHSICHLIEAAGQNPYIAGVNLPTITQATAAAIGQKAKKLGFPALIIDNMLFPLTESPWDHNES